MVGGDLRQFLPAICWHRSWNNRRHRVFLVHRHWRPQPPIISHLTHLSASGSWRLIRMCCLGRILSRAKTQEIIRRTPSNNNNVILPAGDITEELTFSAPQHTSGAAQDLSESTQDSSGAATATSESASTTGLINDDFRGRHGSGLWIQQISQESGIGPILESTSKESKIWRISLYWTVQ